MLQRAASNVCSLWWASHIRTKQSKWLDANVQEMEEKVKAMIKLIDADGDSFARKAELYFRRRPELINHAEEVFRAYKALADRYDRISGELHKANHTIATAFPDQIQLAMDDDYDTMTPRALASFDPNQLHSPVDVSQLVLMNKKMEVPQLVLTDKNTEVARGLMNKNAEECSTPKITQHKKIGPHISTEKRKEAIDNLHKEMLVLHTEKELVKSSYQSSIAKYWEIERQIAEMQEEVCGLQDSFSASDIIEDNEACALMVATAIKSCEDSILSLQEQQKITTEEAMIESKRTKDAKEKLMALKGEFSQSQEAMGISDENSSSWSTAIEENISVLKPERLELQAVCQKVKEHFEVNSKSSVVELADKIDQLVDKVVNLELTITSQIAQIRTLRSENDDLQKHLLGLEEDNVNLIGGSDNLTERLKQAEEELERVQHLEKCFQIEKGVLRTQFNEACHSFDGLSKKLQSPEDQEQNTETQKEVDINEDSVQIQVTTDNKVQEKATEKRVEKTEILQDDANKEGEVKAAYQESTKDDGQVQAQVEELADAPNLKSLPLDVEGREKILLAEYLSMFRIFEETKQRLSELEKNQEHHSEVMVQLNELKFANATKDEEIRILREIMSSLQENVKGNAPHSYANEKERLVFSISKPNSQMTTDSKISDPEENTKIGQEHEFQTNLTSEDTFRAEIDALLYENLDYWLQFSNLNHEIQKLQNAFKELQTEAFKLEKGKLQDTSGTVMTAAREPLELDSAPIEKMLRELNTELQVCLQRNFRLNGELQCRFTSLGSIINEISRFSNSSESENGQITLNQADQFRGEVLDMQLETKKVDKELQDCMHHVRELQVDIAKALFNIHENFKLSASSHHQQNNQLAHISTKPRIPLSTFLFGGKPKKRSSFFACIGSNKPRRNSRSTFPSQI